LCVDVNRPMHSSSGNEGALLRPGRIVAYLEVI
jgi:hypothetical protein